MYHHSVYYRRQATIMLMYIKVLNNSIFVDAKANIPEQHLIEIDIKVRSAIIFDIIRAHIIVILRIFAWNIALYNTDTWPKVTTDIYERRFVMYDSCNIFLVYLCKPIQQIKVTRNKYNFTLICLFYIIWKNIHWQQFDEYCNINRVCGGNINYQSTSINSPI